METIDVWTTSSTPPAAPSYVLNGVRLIHTQTSSSQHIRGWLWWKRLIWKHEFGFKTDIELLADSEIISTEDIISDATVVTVSNGESMPQIPPAPVGFSFTYADLPKQIMRDKWVHRFHYEPTPPAEMQEQHSPI